MKPWQLGLILTTFSFGANAASITLVPTSNTSAVVTGDTVSFDIMMDFTGEPTLGGGLHIYFDPSALQFESFYRSPTLGDPQFGRDPDVFNGLLENWGVGSFDGLPEVAILGNIVFTVLPTMGPSTLISMEDAGDPGPSWISATDFVPVPTQFVPAEVTRVPIPGAAWLLFGGLAALMRLSRD